ncbi:hypothetical protein CIPAW_03G237800 [Carya illinoinensis]|uniref:Uncharacterized protein n=1 Tax=Carya illinoinensis TaxID=32201 RepID=A0A8T1R681_CARIL|nr:hypothetical protein CIPAW_03G237800 [Carya illinoinensis]
MFASSCLRFVLHGKVDELKLMVSTMLIIKGQAIIFGDRSRT